MSQSTRRRSSRLNSRAVDPPPEAPGPDARRSGGIRLLLALLLAATAIALALYQWLAPVRAERLLRSAPLEKLQTLAREAPDDPRAQYHLGHRLLELGQSAAALAALRQAANMDSDDEKSWLGAALAAAATGDTRQALGIATLYSRRHSQDADAHLVLAQVCDQQGSVQHALDEAAAAARLDPRLAAAWRLAGDEALRLGRFPEAEDSLRKAVAAAPGDWRAQLDLGKFLAERGRPEEASACLQAAARLAPTEALPSLLLGRMLLQQAKTPAEVERACQSLTVSAGLQPNNAEIAHQLGLCAVRRSRWAEAQRDLRHALGMAPTDGTVLNDLLAADRHVPGTASLPGDMRHLSRLTAYRQTLRSLTAADRRHPDDLPALLRLARFCASNEDDVSADRYYQAFLAHAQDRKDAKAERDAVESRMAGSPPLPITAAEPTVLSPDDAPASLLLRDADALLAQKRSDQAEEAFLSLLTRDPRSAQAYEGLARVMAAEGKSRQAFLYDDRAAALDPRLWKAQFGVADHYALIGFYRQAADHYRQGLAVAPSNAQAWHSLGLVLNTYASWYQESEGALARATSLQPGNAGFWVDLGHLQTKRHELDAAEASLRRALALAPQDAPVRTQLAAFLVGDRPSPAGLQEADHLLNGDGMTATNGPHLTFWRGRLALAQHNPRLAISLLSAAAPRMDADDAWGVWYYLSRAYLQAGDEKNADQALAMSDHIRTRQAFIGALRDQLNLKPSDVPLNLQLARVAAESGDFTLAINQYETVLRLAPSDVAVRQELDRLEKTLKSQNRLPDMALFDSVVNTGAAESPATRPAQ